MIVGSFIIIFTLLDSLTMGSVESGHQHSAHLSLIITVHIIMVCLWWVKISDSHHQYSMSSRLIDKHDRKNLCVLRAPTALIINKYCIKLRTNIAKYLYLQEHSTHISARGLFIMCKAFLLQNSETWLHIEVWMKHFFFRNLDWFIY